MTENVQGLIDKIKTEGIQAADQQASEIKSKAQTEAQKIIEDAKNQAERIVNDAKGEAKKMQESTQMALKQSSRDTLLSLRKEIERTLQRIITQKIDDALTTENLAEIITSVVKNFAESKEEKADIIVALNPKDLTKLKNGFMSKLQKQLKEPIKFQSSDDIAKGFTISYDGGKSNFDFTDESLSSFLSSFLNEQVATLVKESAKK